MINSTTTEAPEEERPRYKTLLDLLNEPDVDVPFLWQDIFPKNAMCGVVGKSGVSKSTLCRNLLLAVVTRQPTFLGMPLNTIHGKALYVFGEENESWLRKYFRINCKGLKFDKNLLDNLHLLDMQNYENGNDLLVSLKELTSFHNYDLIVFDSYSDLISLFGAELNNNDSIRSLKKQIEFLCNDNTTVLLNHHTSDKSQVLNTFLGASAYKQIVRCLLEIIEDGNRRIISCEKNSYGKKFEPMVCNLTEHFLFETDGETISREELHNIVSNQNFTNGKAITRPKIAPCNQETVSAVFVGCEELTTAQIIHKLILLYAISEPTAKRWIKDVTADDLIEKVSHGKFKVSNLLGQSITSHSINDTMILSFSEEEEEPEEEYNYMEMEGFQ